MKAIAVSTRSRVASLPDVPTVIESGVSGYDVVYWYGTFVPAATPASSVSRLAQETDRTLKQKDVIANLANQGASPGEMTQPQFAQFVREEYQRWTQVVKTSGAKAD